jgi:copper chaperone CopZ
MKIASYSHVTPGRLRIKIHQMKGSQEIALGIERILKGVDGVNSVRANPLTGNALVLFDPSDLSHTDVIEILVKHGYLRKPQKTVGAQIKRSSVKQILHPEYIGKAIADVVLQTAVEFAVKRALLALV